jgi:hypothetical protein
MARSTTRTSASGRSERASEQADPLVPRVRRLEIGQRRPRPGGPVSRKNSSTPMA